MRCFFVFVLCIVCSLSAVDRNRLTILKNDIERVIHRADPTVNIGIDVVNLNTGMRLYSKNRYQRFIPASGLKLFTLAAAFEALGINYRFQTKLYTDGKIENGIIYGNLYLQGCGDPTLKASDLESLASKLHVIGIHDVKGDLIVDASIFDTLAVGPGWMLEDIDQLACWNAPSSGLSVDKSRLDLWIRPSKKEASPAEIISDLSDLKLPFDIDNRTLTVAKNYQSTLNVTAEKTEQRSVVHIGGQLSLQSCPKKQSVSIENPPQWVGVLFKKHLSAKQITVRGKIKDGVTPPQSICLGEHVSESLSTIGQKMCKKTCNFTAHCLFKAIGSQTHGVPGSWKSGSKAIREFLATVVKMDPRDLVFLDGSGLSRYNLIAPSQMTEFLVWNYRNSKYGYEFMSALPVGGVDGTLKSRFTEPSYKGKVRAKTGTMTGISSLSGFCFPDNSDPLVFTIMINGAVKPASELRATIIDPITNLLIDHGH